MPNKEEALQYIKMLAQQKIVTKEEINAAYNSAIQDNDSLTTEKEKIGINEILYGIGVMIILLGVAIFLTQNWSTLGFLTKLLTTLGVGIAAYAAAVILSRDQKTESISSPLYLIFAALMPVGIWTIIGQAGFNADSFGWQSFISGIMLTVFLLSLWIFRKNIFIFFSTVFGTWFFFSLTSWMADASFGNEWRFYLYRWLATGVVYLLMGHYFSKNVQSERVALCGFFYSFGSLLFLGSALLLGGWRPDQNILWELIYPILVFGILFLSVRIKSKSFLIWGTLFLIFYVLKITSEYFSSGLGWPLTLVIAGLAMIVIGYVAFTVNKKYLSNNN